MFFFNKVCTAEIDSVGFAWINDRERKVPFIKLKAMTNKKLLAKMFNDGAFEGLQFFYLRRFNAVQLKMQEKKYKMSIVFKLPDNVEILAGIMQEKELVMQYLDPEIKIQLDISSGVDAFQQEFRDSAIGDYLKKYLEGKDKPVPDFEEFKSSYLDAISDKWRSES